MRASRLIWLVGIVTAVPGTTPQHELPSLRPNSNIERAGTLEHGVLTVALEAKESQWVDEGSGNRPLRLAAHCAT